MKRKNKENDIPRNGALLVGALSAVLVLLSGLSLFIGAARTDAFILVQSRLPRLLALVLSGAGLSSAGIIMQRISRNRFESPETAGTMDAATLGFVLGLVLIPGMPVFFRTLLSAACAGLGALAFFRIIRAMGPRSEAGMPLAGMVLGTVIQGTAQVIAYRFDLIQTLSGWISADFSLTIAGRFEILFLVVPAAALALYFAQHLTLIGMGRDTAESLGMNYELLRGLGIGIVSLISSLTIIVGGRVPFLGLIVPNMLSGILGDHIKSLLPVAALAGASLLLAADLFGRIVIAPYEMPVGLTMGIVGGCVFLRLVGRLRREQHV